MKIVKKFKYGTQIGKKGNKYILLNHKGRPLYGEEEASDIVSFSTLSNAIAFVEEEHVDEYCGKQLRNLTAGF